MEKIRMNSYSPKFTHTLVSFSLCLHFCSQRGNKDFLNSVENVKNLEDATTTLNFLVQVTQ